MLLNQERLHINTGRAPILESTHASTDPDSGASPAQPTRRALAGRGFNLETILLQRLDLSIEVSARRLEKLYIEVLAEGEGFEPPRSLHP